jgi:hypothetical protein
MHMESGRDMTDRDDTESPRVRQCAVCDEETETILISSRGGDFPVCRDDLKKVPPENRRDWP